MELETLKPDPRRNPFTLMEKEYLVDLVEEHKDILDPVIRYNDSMTIFRRKQAWKVIREIYNKRFKENIRDVEQLKRMWSKIKIQIKKYMNVPRSENNIWNLARVMFRQYSRNGRDDAPTKDTESIRTQISVRRDTASSQTESETNGSQQETSTPHTNVSSDDDLIIMNVVSENRSEVTAGDGDVIEVLNNEHVTNGFLPMTYSVGNENKDALVSNHVESAPIPVQIERTHFINNYQNLIGSNSSSTTEHQSQPILTQPISNTDCVTSFAYFPELSTSKSSENTGEYSLWQDIHCVDDNVTPEASSSGNGVGRSRRRRQYGFEPDHSLNRGKVVKSRQDFYRNRCNKRNFNRLRNSKRWSPQDRDELYEESEVEDGRPKEENLLSESSYRKRMLALAEVEHAQKMRLLKLKCEVLELQKQELASKLQK